jgi:hypothetical protein
MAGVLMSRGLADELAFHYARKRRAELASVMQQPEAGARRDRWVP